MTPTAKIIDMIPDERLIHIIRHSNDFTWSFFAMKVILNRLNMKITMYKDDRSILPVCCNELRTLLKKSVNVPNSQADLKKILSIA